MEKWGEWLDSGRVVGNIGADLNRLPEDINERSFPAQFEGGCK